MKKACWGLIFMSLATRAQSVSTTASPPLPAIVIERLETTPIQGGDSVKLFFRNASSKGIVAYVLYVRAYSGQRLVESVIQQFVTAIPAERKLKPGQTWEATASLIRSSEIAPNPTDRAEPIIDWILFDDMTTAGPDQRTLGVRTRAEIEGALRERARLREILKEKDAEGLAEAVNRDEGFPKRVKPAARVQ